MSNPIAPDSKVVKEYLQDWKKMKKYTIQEKSLSLLFHKFCPKNEDIEGVLLKVSALNDFYSTNIFNTYAMAKHILTCNTDSGLERGEIELVDRIALVTINGKIKKLYSFASKYCSHHRSETYPIYDSYVEKMLMHFNKTDKFERFKKDDLKVYSSFIDIIKKFKDYYNLDSFTLREIDIYLWQAGKRHFPNKF